MTDKTPELQVGDEVCIVSRRYSEGTLQGLHKVERETKTLLIVDGRRFRKKDHEEHVAREPWSASTKIIPTDSKEAKALVRKARIRFARDHFHTSVDRPNRGMTDLEAALNSRERLNTYIRLLTEDQQ